MGFFTGVAQLLLPLLTLIGIFGTLKFASENGTFDMITKDLAAHSPELPNSSYRLRTDWTGFQPIDTHLQFVISFFWPTVDGKMPNLTMLGTHFFGQLSAIWTVMLVESYRVGNNWGIVSFITIYGLLLENVAMAITLPAWCFLHLLTSPIAAPPSKNSLSARKTVLLVHPAELRVLPWSILLGHGIPTALMILADPTALKLPFYYSAQFWLAARLFHPVFTAVIHLVLSIFSRTAEIGYSSAEQRNRTVLRALQRVYAFATYLSVLTHVGVFAILFVAHFFPQMIASGYKSLLQPSLLFVPARFWDSPVPKASNVGHGVLMLLQWDELVTCVAALLWAFALHRQSVPKETGFWSTLFTTTAVAVFGGPAAAVISLLRERDQIILDEMDESEKKDQ